MQERVGIYNRCSTEEESQINALGTQAAESREIAISKGWMIAAQYIESESGTTTRKREEYLRLLEDMENDLFDIVMIKSIDRLTRSAKDWYLFLDKLTSNKKKLYIYIDHKFYTPDDSLLTGIKAMLAEDFSRELSKKIRNAHHRRQEKKSGLNITRPMFGWDKVNKDTFVINEEEAQAYRLAFAMAKEGHGFYTISNYMYDKGVRGKNGRKISDVQWRNMLYSPRAHGTVAVHTTEHDFEAKKRRKLPESEWIYIENALPPIIDYAYHKEVLDAIADRTVSNHFTNYTRNMTKIGLYALSGRLYCAECGAVYYRTSSESKGEKRIKWKCSNALKNGRRAAGKEEGCNNINVLEMEILKQIEEACKAQYGFLFKREEGVIEEALAIVRKVIGNDYGERELKKLERELERQKQKKRILFDKLTDGVITDSDFQLYKEEIDLKIYETETGIACIKEKYSEYNEYEERLQKIKEALKDGAIIEEAKSRELIQRIDKIWIYPDHQMEIIFDKTKLLSFIKIYAPGVDWQDLEKNFFCIKAPYVHRTSWKGKEKS